MLQDLFSAPPYGWSKDAVRYVFAALLVSGEVKFHVPGADGPVRTRGPQAVEAVKSTVAFNRVGVSPRDGRPPAEALDRAAHRLEDLLGVEVLPLEDRISEVVRKHLPAVLETIGSLPDRLRLLGLSGEDRARQVLGDAADLLKGDAGNATAVLGTADCQIPDNIQWARSIIKALGEGAEDDLRCARRLLDEHRELAALFPDNTAGLLSDADRQTFTDILSSDRFHKRIPDLRGAIRGLLDRVSECYTRHYAPYSEALLAGLRELEAHPDWARLSDDNREELAARLANDLADKCDEDRPMQSLQTLLVRSASLPGLVAQIVRRSSQAGARASVSPVRPGNCRYTRRHGNRPACHDPNLGGTGRMDRGHPFGHQRQARRRQARPNYAKERGMRYGSKESTVA